MCTENTVQYENRVGQEDAQGWVFETGFEARGCAGRLWLHREAEQREGIKMKKKKRVSEES